METTTGVDPTIKRVTITAEAAAGTSAPLTIAPEEPAPTGGARRRTQRKARKLDLTNLVVTKSGGQDGGGSTSPGTMVQLAASRVPGSDSSHAVGASSALTVSAAAVGRVAPAAANDPVGATSGGATPTHSLAHQRVVLAKPKNKTAKVLLAAPKHGKKVGGAVASTSAKPHGHRKTAKKVHMSLKGLTSKLRRAKTIRKKATRHTLEEIKQELLKAGLIKADSKAPEDILRQMYADFMTLKKKAL